MQIKHKVFLGAVRVHINIYFGDITHNILTSASDKRQESSDFQMKLEAVKSLKQFSRITDIRSAFKNSVDIPVSYTCLNTHTHT